MADQAPHDWQLLSRICNSLGRPDHQLYASLAHDSYPKEYRLLALESAFRSGAIPMHGCREFALGSEATERIETKIDAETLIEITLDEITLRRTCQEPAAQIEIAVFKRVQADSAIAEQWLSEVDEPKAAGEETQDNVEAECRTWLAAHPDQPRFRKKQARNSFNEIRRKAKSKTIGERPFNRAWEESAPSSWHAPGRMPGN